MRGFLIVLTSLVLGCGLDSPNGENSAASEALRVRLSASADQINSGGKVAISAIGGTGKYIFNVDAGGGTLVPDGNLAIYTAPVGLTVNSTVVISAQDEAGQSDSVAIVILGTSVPTGLKLFNMAGTASFTVPDGVTAVRVTAVGGGGAAGAYGAPTIGSGGVISAWGGGAGGGGSGATCATRLTVTAGQVLAGAVGIGGAGAAFVADLLLGFNATGGNGGQTTFEGLAADGGQGGIGGRGTFLFTGSASGGAGGLGGACSAAGNRPSVAGAAGQTGSGHAQVAGSPSLHHADGGAGGSGQLINGLNCGAGATGDPRTTNSAISPAGNAGCILIEWGAGI